VVAAAIGGLSASNNNWLSSDGQRSRPVEQGSRRQPGDQAGIQVLLAQPRNPRVQRHRGSKDHWISGHRVDVFHEHDKNVVVFYRSKQTIPKSFLRPQKDYIDITLDRRSSSSDDIYAFICSQAKSCHTFLSQKLSFHQLAVIKRYSGLFYNIRLGLKSYEHNGEYLTAIIFPF
jgi:hypothetical protein